MKRTLTLAMACLFIVGVAGATVIVDDDFTYPDGSLIDNAPWNNHSGTPGDLLVANGAVTIQHGIPSEDANYPFPPTGGDNIYFGIDFWVNASAPISGTDNEYFAHFKDSGFGFTARLDVVPALGGGDFSVGIGSDDSVADAIWPTDLTFGVVYRAVACYSQVSNIATLWIDPTAFTDPSILGDDQPDPGDVAEAFALRQSDSDLNETVFVDNLLVADVFDEVCPECPPVATEESSWGEVKSLY